MHLSNIFPADKENTGGFCLAIDANSWSQSRKKLGEISNSPRRNPETKKEKGILRDLNENIVKEGGLSCGLEPPILRLGQFQEVPWVDFGSVILGEKHTVRLSIQNPMEKIGTLIVDRVPSKHGISVSHSERTVVSGGKDYIEIHWTPEESGPLRCNLYFKCNKRIPLQVKCLGTGQSFSDKVSDNLPNMVVSVI
jgi:hypothetical protein